MAASGSVSGRSPSEVGSRLTADVDLRPALRPVFSERLLSLGLLHSDRSAWPGVQCC
jgi:hypothetical protein